jgi:hypothetical protein
VIKKVSLSFRGKDLCKIQSNEINAGKRRSRSSFSEICDQPADFVPSLHVFRDHPRTNLPRVSTISTSFLCNGDVIFHLKLSSLFVDDLESNVIEKKTKSKFNLKAR